MDSGPDTMQWLTAMLWNFAIATWSWKDFIIHINVLKYVLSLDIAAAANDKSFVTLR